MSSLECGVRALREESRSCKTGPYILGPFPKIGSRAHSSFLPSLAPGLWLHRKAASKSSSRPFTLLHLPFHCKGRDDVAPTLT